MKDIPTDRAITAIRSAIKHWQESPRNRSPGNIKEIIDDPSNVFDQIRKEFSKGGP